jgi:hypothetical protein
MAIVSVEELISRGIVSREYKRIGCCYRTVIKFAGENKYYNYENGRPLSKILSNKISNPLYNRLVLNMDRNAVKGVLKRVYKSSQNIVKLKQIYKNIVNINAKRVTSSYASKFKASIIQEVSALKKYTNVISISGIKLKGLKGLSYIRYQYELIKDYMKKFHSLKLLTDVTFRVSKNAEELTDEQEFYTRSRVHIANSPNELEQVLEKWLLILL